MLSHLYIWHTEMEWPFWTLVQWDVPLRYDNRIHQRLLSRLFLFLQVYRDFLSHDLVLLFVVSFGMNSTYSLDLLDICELVSSHCFQPSRWCKSIYTVYVQIYECTSIEYTEKLNVAQALSQSAPAWIINMGLTTPSCLSLSHTHTHMTTTTTTRPLKSVWMVSLCRQTGKHGFWVPKKKLFCTPWCHGRVTRSTRDGGERENGLTRINRADVSFRYVKLCMNLDLYYSWLRQE